jgi:hypothetical protein
MPVSSDSGFLFLISLVYIEILIFKAAIDGLGKLSDYAAKFKREKLSESEGVKASIALVNKVIAPYNK